VNADDMKQLAQLLQKMPGIKSIELKDVKRLVQLLKQSPEIGSIEVTGFFGTGVVITRTPAGVPAAQASAAPLIAMGNPAPQALLGAPAGAIPPPAQPVPTPSALREIKSPMVGTYYKAPEPGADAYVKVGTRVTAGQTVCIIEAMKIMNEIEAELTGVVREICVEDGQPVEFGQVLFRVDPNG
jgi:acetyl-CoA carboxylase biotin carboxyl carrier protein